MKHCVEMKLRLQWFLIHFIPVFVCISALSTINIHDEISHNMDAEGYKIFHPKDVDLKLECNASHPYHFVSWSHRGATLTRTDRISWDNTSVLTIQNFNTSKDVGIYECIVKNSISILPSLKFDIAVSPTADIPKIVGVEEGGKLTLPCNVTGHPTPLVHWKIGKEILFESYGRIILKEYNNVPSSLLEIENVTEKDLGKYTCSVTNPVISGESIDVTSLVQLESKSWAISFTIAVSALVLVLTMAVYIKRIRQKRISMQRHKTGNNV